MKNKLTSTWGVVPGRHLGGQASGRFHKRRKGTPEERGVAKANGITLKEARRIVRFAAEEHARRSPEEKDQDWLTLQAMRRERLAREEERAKTEDKARRERVAAYLETLKED